MSSKPAPRGRAARLARLIPAGRARAARTPFVLLVVLLLGGGLLGLLVLNSALSEGSFELDDIQRRTKSLTDEEQALQRDIDAYSAPDALQRRARELGMVPGGDPAFLDPDGSVKGVPSPAPRSAALTGPLTGGCCGLAGNFGFERGHFDISRTCAEDQLLPALHSAPESAAVLADGYSCRTQIEQLTGIRARHLAEVLAEGLDREERE
ncbi:(Fe-S)-binding protein [Streptomyces recifensis]|uniref:(Fe-S)-binding protein n=1 Tax=Streptomyces recifensis TaxID=67355 RepID=UPI00142E6BB7|nr:(Fe-S)-binding protein [Streptomyces recifensis]